MPAPSPAHTVRMLRDLGTPSGLNRDLPPTPGPATWSRSLPQPRLPGPRASQTPPCTVALDWRGQCGPRSPRHRPTACPHHGLPLTCPTCSAAHCSLATASARWQGRRVMAPPRLPGANGKWESARPIRASQPPRPRPLPTDTLGCRSTPSASGRATSDDP